MADGLEEEAWQRASRLRPKLTAEQQVAHLKSRGVTFKGFSEAQAADYLGNTSNYTHSACYRKLYPVKAGGGHAGEYIRLDFSALVALSSADRVLRSSLREICIDVEHFARLDLLRRCDEHREDGYAIVADYFSHCQAKGNSRAMSTLKTRSTSGKYPDEYSGDLIAHYNDDLGAIPDWALLEVVDFGTFTDFWLFCAERWEDKGMAEVHYILKSVKALRNACSHNTCIINGFAASAAESDYETPESILASMSSHGMKNCKSRRKKMANQRIAQIAAALFASSTFCTRPTTMARHAAAMQQVKGAFRASSGLCPADGSLTSYFEFLSKMIDIWTPARA